MGITFISFGQHIVSAGTRDLLIDLLFPSAACTLPIMLHVQLDLAPVEPWLEVWTKIVPGTRYNCILEKIENWSLWSWKTLQTVWVALGCEAHAVPPHNLPFLLPFLPNNWVTSLRRTSSLLTEKRLECSALSITCWPLMVGCPSQPLTPCKLLLPFLKTHRRVKLKVSIRAATGSMAVACLFSAEGLGGVSPCDLLASFINPSVRRAQHRRGLFAASCDFLTARPALSSSFVSLSSASVCAALPCFLPSFSNLPVSFPIIFSTSSLRILLKSLSEVLAGQAPESVFFLFDSHFWRCALTRSRKEQ